ncbi:hypothetical protein THAOC_02909, partial [Thalassiosira oceanica]
MNVRRWRAQRILSQETFNGCQNFLVSVTAFNLKSTGGRAEEYAEVAACLLARGGLEIIQTVEDIGSGVSTQVSSRREHALKRNPPSVLTAVAIAVKARAVLKSTGECAKVAACLFACGGLEAIQTVEDIGSGVDVGRRALGAVHAHLPRRAILATSKGDRQLLRIIEKVPLDHVSLGCQQFETFF